MAEFVTKENDLHVTWKGSGYCMKRLEFEGGNTSLSYGFDVSIFLFVL